MSFDYIAGLASNLATAATITASSEDANFLASNVAIGWPARPFIFNAAGLDDTIDFDLLSALSPTFFSIHGHNLDAGITSIEIFSDDNSGFTSPVTEATITTYTSPTLFKLVAAPTSHQYWRFKFNGTNGNPGAIGEIVIGVKKSLTHTQLDHWTIDDDRPQNRQLGEQIPQVFATNLTDHPQRLFTGTFVAESYTERNQIRDELLDNTKRGAEPLVFIPDEDDEIVIHGRVPKRVRWERRPGPNGGYHRATISISEDPFAIALT